MKVMYLIFSDLDGTLLDEDTYSFKEAKAAIDFLKSKNFPLILCSSKTRLEIEIYHEEMGLYSYPFISENGGAIFIPKGTLNLTNFNFKFVNGYQTIEIGAPYEFIKKCFQKIKKDLKLNIKGFSEMEIEEIVSLTNLSPAQAKLAQRREYSEPFIYKDEPDKLPLLKKAINEFGLNLTRGGRFYTLMAGNDKGKAVQIVTKLYQQTFLDKVIVSIGLGDSLNDVPMLLHVDRPVIVKRKRGASLRCDFKNAYLTQASGPQGWAEAIFKILKEESNERFLSKWCCD